MTDLAAAEQAITDLVRRWIDTYLARVETANDLPPRYYGGRAATRFRSWQIDDNISLLPEQTLPALHVVSPGAVDEPEDTGGGVLTGRYGFTIIAAVKSGKRADTQRAARHYGHAIAELLDHKAGELDGIRLASRPIDTYDEAPRAGSSSSEYRGVAAVAFQAWIDGIRERQGGPDDPIPPDTDPPEVPDAPEVQDVTFTVTHLDDPETP